jgi:hypothetical protein
VSHALDQVRLFGLDEVSSSVRQYDLSVAYISLGLALTLNDEDDGYDGGDDSDESPYSKIEGVSVDASFSIEQILSREKRLLLVGEAGSGKTTLLQWLAVQATLGWSPEKSDLADAPIPFIIRLRSYVDRPLPTPAEFVAEVGPSIVGLMPDQWVEGLLDDGRGLVLIDGLDELPLERRGTVERWLSDLVAAFPSATYVVTSPCSDRLRLRNTARLCHSRRTPDGAKRDRSVRGPLA